MSVSTLSSDYRINALLGGTQWGSGTGQPAFLTYSIPSTGAYWGQNYGNGEPDYSWTPITHTQAEYFAQALDTWSEVANVHFTSINERNSRIGDIRVAISPVVGLEGDGAVAWAYSPASSGYWAEAGDVWLNSDEDLDYAPSKWGFTVFIHELGHALGLKHPFDSETFSHTLLSEAEDSYQYTVMSYTPYDGAGYVYTPNNGGYTYDTVMPSTPMLYDILAMQYLYGANINTRTGNDTYTFSNAQGELKTIWDAGGEDTFDLSNQTLGQTINLNDGQFSSLGVQQTSYQGALSIANNNVAIAFGVNIENAIGGNGNDTFVGNALNNRIEGGLGSDIVIFSGNHSSYQINGGLEGSFHVSSTADGVDTLSGIESLHFADSTVRVAPIPTTAAMVDKTPTEGSGNHINWFLLQLSSPATTESSVHYQTRDGTALAGSDYIATSGIAEIAVGSSSTVIGVEIIGDTLAETDEIFYLDITNPIGGNFGGAVTLTAVRTIVNDDGWFA